MGIIKYLKQEIKIVKERDPAFRINAEIFLYPSFKAILKYRMAHWFYERGHFYIARRISQKAARKTGIEIHPGAKIGKGLFIDHGHGVVIGETCEIGDNVTIYQGVTLGGTGKEKGKRHPTIGNNVMISAGAKILGSFTVGDNSRIGAGSVVLSEVPPNSTVVGIPGRVVRRGDDKSRPCESMDQVHLPDPVKMELCKLEAEIQKLKKEMQELIKVYNTIQFEKIEEMDDKVKNERSI